MFQIAFSPEIRKRLQSGALEEGFTLSAVQMIQPLNGNLVIRLNEEVRGIGLFQIAPLERPVKKGDPVYFSDLKKLERFDLESDDLNSGHFSMLWNGQVWLCSFDFRTGRDMS